MSHAITVPTSTVSHAVVRPVRADGLKETLARIGARRADVQREKRGAKIAAIAARLLLATLFIVAGASGFFLYHNPPPAPPGLGAAFQDVFFRSGWVLFVDVMEFAVGVLLLVNRFVPLALVALAGILFNIYVFHITMAPAGLPAPIIVTALWLIVAWPLRSHFKPLLASRPTA